jgi:hypothetical protein
MVHQIDPHGRPIDAKATAARLNGGGTPPSDRVQLREIVVINEGFVAHAPTASGCLPFADRADISPATLVSLLFEDRNHGD